MLFLCEQLANDEAVLDCNFSPALAQLFHLKVMHHVRGPSGMTFCEWIRYNPDWEKVSRPFLFEGLLKQLKGGRDLGVDELKPEMKKVLITK